MDRIFVIDTLNFCFWNEHPSNPPFTIQYHGKNYTGYYSLCAAINRAIEVISSYIYLLLVKNGVPILSPQFFANISKVQLEEIFKSETPTPIPLFEKRLEVLHEAGRY